MQSGKMGREGHRTEESRRSVTHVRTQDNVKKSRKKKEERLDGGFQRK